MQGQWCGLLGVCGWAGCCCHPGVGVPVSLHPPALLSKGFVPAKAAQELFCFSPLSGLFFSS